MKNLIKIITIISIFSIKLKAQDLKRDNDKLITKMDLYNSKTGSIIKFTDTKISWIKTISGSVEARVRKVQSGGNPDYFYQIIKQGKYTNSTASIEYSDLLEVMKAIALLREELKKDIISKPNYLENKFVTNDGFYIGYFINEGDISWYLKLDKYSSDSTIFLESIDSFDVLAIEAKSKIEELKK